MYSPDAPKASSMRKEIQTALLRGLKKRCPQCGIGPLYQGWHLLHENCVHCDCELQDREGNCWAFMYFSTAFITGLFICIVLLTRPTNLILGQIVIVISALFLMAATLPYRKGIAIAIDYLVDSRVAPQPAPNDTPKNKK